jgi:adenylate cyclase
VLATLPAEPLRVRVLRLNRMLELLPDPAGPDTLDLNFDGERWQTSATHFRPGPVRLSWQNQSEAACTAVIEKEQWDPDAATAARVMAIPEFRALFSSEVLQPGRQIGIRNLCVLFTDLKGSTALYEKVGDAPAYGRVHRHFDFLIDCFTRHEGGIVKTIGDAVMASFPSPECALRAALEVQQHVAAFNARLNVKEPIVIKIGLHHGPAIAVNANGQMDYFGRTVNIAARIQGLSEGGDVVLSAALWSEPRIQEVLQGAPFAMERFSAELKGIAGTVPMCRLTLSERPPVAPEAEAARRAESPAAGGAAAPAAGAAAPHGAAGPSATPRVFRY